MKLKRERSGCKFLVTETDEGLEITLELFHDTPSLQAVSLGFEVLRGSTTAQAKTLVDAMNDRIVTVIATPK